jgi:hypothetical protein
MHAAAGLSRLSPPQSLIFYVGPHMSAHNGGSGPRSNSYSENRFTNWSEYGPWWLEVQSIFKRFDGRLAKNPKFPKVIELEPLEGFVRPCFAGQVEVKLSTCPVEHLNKLRAVFILSGTKKQLRSWNSSSAFYGHYWRSCVFLHAYPCALNPDLDWLRRFYISDVLMHEIGHHLDFWNTTLKDRERFANRFARKHG